MTAGGLTRYVDRRTGALREDPVYAPRLMRWAYDTAPGWWLTTLVLSRPAVSRCYGWLHRQRWSRREIPDFVRRLGIDRRECTRPLGEYESLNAFVVRDIDLARRPVDRDPTACVAPVDGRVLAWPHVEPDRVLRVKHARLDLASLLRDPRRARAYAGGALLVFRLHLSDYHHFHFPLEGTPSPAVAIRGRLFAVTPYSARRLVPFVAENARMLTALATERFGAVLMIEIGAFTIGSIQQRYRPGWPVDRGAHKGFFELGGSVVVLVFPRDTIRLDEDLCANTARGLETYVRLGERVGSSWGASTGPPIPPDARTRPG